ncbi:serine/threonine protein kinase [Actinomyces denticolens]|uniref:non-specific serine/threonine protein kinase n=1 Tax=Actinomyces denticolens TaxID=52767 RepID=A0ABY1I867_9ACTO|nr:serine/threonine-protein kinase [Actinomyces denticolens]SHI75192.1 serine/threonine protein kinase [Actinomyces denticolens]
MTSPDEPRPLGSSYVLNERIGRGAQGEVWLASRTERADDSAPLAVKVLRADLIEDPSVVERFVRERATLMRVHSPYVIAVRDMVVEGTTFAIVMDYVPGPDLREAIMSTGPLPPAALARLGARIAEGLVAVHAAGVVHRDIKPANILLENWQADARRGRHASPAGPSPDQAPSDAAATMTPSAVTTWGDGGIVAPIPRIADFGIARICDSLATVTGTGAVGTPLYMAPETIAGAQPAPAADVYALGIVLYELACGVPPYVGQPVQVLAQHAQRDPGRPAGIPDDLWNLIASMLAKRPDLRPTMQRVAESLEQMVPALQGLPATAALASPPPTMPSVMPYGWEEAMDPAAGGGGAASTPTTASGPSESDPAGHAETLAASASTPPTMAAPWLSPGQAGRAAPTIAMGSSPASDGAQRATLMSSAGTVPTTAVMPGGVGAAGPGQGWSGAVPGGGPGSPSLPAAAYSPPGLVADGAAPPRRRRRRRMALGGLAVLLVLSLAAGGAWWWLRSAGTEGRSAMGWTSGIAAGSGADSVLELTGIDEEFRLSPEGSVMLAKGSGVGKFNTFSLYDLASSSQEAVWTGECNSAVAFWTERQVICQRNGASASVLVSLAADGTATESASPLAKDQTPMGSDGTRAIVHSGSYEGNLMALDSAGNTVWTVRGEYQKAIIRDGFIEAYDSWSQQTVVLDSATGKKIANSSSGSSSDFDGSNPQPGGIGIDAGPQTVYHCDGTTCTVYDSAGSSVGTATDPGRSSWALSGPVTPKRLLEILQRAGREGIQGGEIDLKGSMRLPSLQDPNSDGKTLVAGADRMDVVTVDSEACTATVGATSLSIPPKEVNDRCRINPVGWTADDKVILVQLGGSTPGIPDKGDILGAYDPSTGAELWRVPGAWAAVPGRGAEAEGSAVRAAGIDPAGLRNLFLIWQANSALNGEYALYRANG